MGRDLTGKIKSVYCKHFVTYEETIFTPGEYLNLIIGPNGSGKSTIVSAIVLGLGGEPVLLNRSHSICDYIKNGREQAIIKVELYGRNNNSIVFGRTFDSSGDSKYSIDSHDVSKKKFLEAIASFNIQISNLCQFLPQDRVQDFLKMNAQELLVNTIASVCNQELIDKFQKLKSLRKNYMKGNGMRKDDVEKLQQLQSRLEHLQVYVNEFNEREEYRKQVDLYNAKKLWLEVDEMKEKAREYGSDLATAKDKHDQHKKIYEKLVERQSSVLKKSERMKQETQRKHVELQKAKESINQFNSTVDELKNNLHESKRELDRNILSIQQQQEQLLKETKMLKAIHLDLQTNNSALKSETERKSECERNLRDLTEQKNILMRKRTDINRKLEDEYLAEVNMLKNKINRITNVQEQKMQWLQTHHLNVYTAVCWLDQHRDMFAARIYKPMILELNIPDPAHAKYFENTIKNRDLLAFTCENTHDMSLLIDELCIKQSLGINVIHSPPAEHCTFTPKTPIDKISCYGLTAYMVDLVQGPAPIINKLCAAYNIHNIPIGNENVASHTNSIPNHIGQFFGGNKRYNVISSRYRSDTTLSEIIISGKNWLSSSNLKEISSLKSKLNDILKETDALKNARTKIEANLNEVEFQRKELLETKRSIDAKFARKDQLLSDYRRQEQKVKRLSENKDSVETLESKFEKGAKEAINKIFQYETQKVAALKAFQAILAEKNMATAKEYIFQNENVTEMNNLKEAENNVNQAKNLLDTITNKLDSFKRKYNAKVAEAKELCNNCKPNEPNFPYSNEFTKLSKLSMEQIKERLTEYQARIECLGNVNQQANQEYITTKEQIVQLEDKIENTEREDQNLDAKIREIHASWEPEITTLVSTISQHFSHFMKSINCVGEVSLFKREELDFDSYGIQIMVQYRKNTPIQTLDKHLQSGGERAVAIALYTLSLQNITNVPFRCVDEINQGMDAKNERAVFNMLLKETTKEGSAQYLFVTPKLLRDLEYNERICISLIHNGKHMGELSGFPLE